MKKIWLVVGIITACICVGIAMFIINENNKIKLLPIVDEVTIEAKSDFNYELHDLIEYPSKIEDKIMLDMNEIQFDQLGVYPVYITYKSQKVNIDCHVVDTIAPQVVLKETATIDEGDTISLEDIILEVNDATKVDIKTMPELSNLSSMENGTTSILIKATDEAGNQTELQVNLTIMNKKNGVKQLDIKVDESLLSMKDQVLECLEDTHNIGIYYYNLKTGESWDINGTQEFRSASIKKLLTANYYYAMIEEGKINPNTVLKYTEDCFEDGSGYIQFDLPQIQSYTISYLLEVMIIHSDNIAYHMLNKYAGGFNEIEKYNQERGNDTNTSGDVNYMSAKDGAMVLLDIYKNNYTKCLDDLTNTIFTNRMDKYIDIPVAHKIGTYYENIHDVGIVYFKDNPYILSIFTRLEDEELIANISKVIYDRHVYEQS